MNPPLAGFFTLGDNTYQVNSFPVDVNQENIGILSIGERFDLSEFSSPTVLAQNGKILRSSVPRASAGELEASLDRCQQQAECEVKLAGETYLTLPSDSIRFGNGYMLRSFQSVDSVSSSCARRSAPRVFDRRSRRHAGRGRTDFFLLALDRSSHRLGGHTASRRRKNGPLADVSVQAHGDSGDQRPDRQFQPHGDIPARKPREPAAGLYRVCRIARQQPGRARRLHRRP